MFAKSALITAGLFFAQLIHAAVPAPVDAPPSQLPPITDDSSSQDIDNSLGGFKPSGRESQDRHPDFNPYIGNKPSDAWYGDMYQQLYKMKEAAYYVKKWAYDQHNDRVYGYGNWLEKSLDRYLSYTYYYKNGSYYPRYYNYGSYSYYPTRGDHNYYYYYYVRPIYYQIYREIGSYGHRDDYYYKTFSYFSQRYKSYTRCNYGYNGDDQKSQFDTDSATFEKAAGL